MKERISNVKYLISVVRFADDITPQTRMVIEFEATHYVEDDVFAFVKREFDIDAEYMRMPVARED